MNNLEKYNKVFIETFSIGESDLSGELEYNSIQEWDSIGHMELIAEIEESFDISMEMDDIINFGSYLKGIEIMSSYGITIDVP